MRGAQLVALVSFFATLALAAPLGKQSIGNRDVNVPQNEIRSNLQAASFEKRTFRASPVGSLNPVPVEEKRQFHSAPPSEEPVSDSEKRNFRASPTEKTDPVAVEKRQFRSSPTVHGSAPDSKRQFKSPPPSEEPVSDKRQFHSSPAVHGSAPDSKRSVEGSEVPVEA